MAGHKPNQKSDPFVTTATESHHLPNTVPGKDDRALSIACFCHESFLLRTAILEVASPGGSVALRLCRVLWRLWSTRLALELGTEGAQG